MEIRIGIINAPRELVFESSKSAKDITKAFASALEAKAPFVELEDDKGATFVVPTAGIAYVQVGAEETRRVGFVA